MFFGILAAVVQMPLNDVINVNIVFITQQILRICVQAQLRLLKRPQVSNWFLTAPYICYGWKPGDLQLTGLCNKTKRNSCKKIINTF